MREKEMRKTASGPAKDWFLFFFLFFWQPLGWTQRHKESKSKHGLWSHSTAALYTILVGI